MNVMALEVLQHGSTVFRFAQPLGLITKTKNKLHGLSPRANYTDRATAACRRSDCQLVRIEIMYDYRFFKIVLL
jgi:hypothetical protein